MKVKVRLMSDADLIKHDQDKDAFGLIPIRPLRLLARLYTYGASKYGKNNWRKGGDWSRLYDAIQRHLTAFWEGQDIDEVSAGGSGLPHVIAAAWGCLTLCEYMLLGIGKDDRADKRDNGLIQITRGPFCDTCGQTMKKAFIPGHGNEFYCECLEKKRLESLPDWVTPPAICSFCEGLMVVSRTPGGFAYHCKSGDCPSRPQCKICKEPMTLYGGAGSTDVSAGYYCGCGDRRPEE